jgi:hypothetical protein
VQRFAWSTAAGIMAQGAELCQIAGWWLTRPVAALPGDQVMQELPDALLKPDAQARQDHEVQRHVLRQARPADWLVSTS